MSSEDEKTIYTLGTSTRSPEEFISLLTGHRIEAVADVRRFPTSRFEHFKRENLAGLLHGSGIEYIYLGDELGGYRRGGYPNFTTTPEFQAGLARLERIARERKTAFICAERFPWRCHRRFIAMELERRGWPVIHILDKSRDWVPGKHS
jgi:uncharacterized protein (DUF488 family)